MSTILFIFSGIENFSKKFYKDYYPDIIICSSRKKGSFIYNKIIENKIKSIKGISAFSKTIEKNILLNYNNKEYFFSLKGIDSEYEKVMKRFKKIDLTNISYPDHINIYIEWSSIKFYFPIIFRTKNKIPTRILFFSYKKKNNSFIPFFTSKKIFIKGFYKFIKNMDTGRLFCNLSEFQNVLKKNEIQKLEIKVQREANIQNIKYFLNKKLGNEFNIFTRIEKEKSFYKVLNTEKLFVYFLFILIVLITIFNLFGAIFILQLDKKKEIFILWCIGFPLYKIRNIFLYMGFLITIFGCFSGLLLSYIISIIQEKYHFIKVIDKIPFPVKITMVDSCIVLSIIFTIGIIISIISSGKIKI
ncbi:ABC transporter permease [Blattabacterium cuenoti]|uniref:ABC transporter permease n=1 Tax=Blattabacterium cuenoti TaxID=1653831 RepID=UPI001EECB8F6|nr:FtsX-like permease family protein [Blattabacterium cuenoti]